jgi:pimeloyl-ACP methyl ester carboxylesterase
MGLGAMKYAWQRQTKDFAHDKGEQYSSLILDNRGIGESDKPMKRYSTSEMAKDIIEVVDELGWTSKRELHIIGISMGGMIAQEMVGNFISVIVLGLLSSLSYNASSSRLSYFSDVEPSVQIRCLAEVEHQELQNCRAKHPPQSQVVPTLRSAPPLLIFMLHIPPLAATIEIQHMLKCSTGNAHI